MSSIMSSTLLSIPVAHPVVHTVVHPAARAAFIPATHPALNPAVDTAVDTVVHLGLNPSLSPVHTLRQRLLLLLPFYILAFQILRSFQLPPPFQLPIQPRVQSRVHLPQFPLVVVASDPNLAEFTLNSGATRLPPLDLRQPVVQLGQFPIDLQPLGFGADAFERPVDAPDARVDAQREVVRVMLLESGAGRDCDESFFWKARG